MHLIADDMFEIHKKGVAQVEGAVDEYFPFNHHRQYISGSLATT